MTILYPHPRSFFVPLMPLVYVQGMVLETLWRVVSVYHGTLQPYFYFYFYSIHLVLTLVLVLGLTLVLTLALVLTLVLRPVLIDRPYIGGWELNARGLNIGMPMPDTLSVNFTEQVRVFPPAYPSWTRPCE